MADLRLFEIGKTYSMDSQGLPQERQVLTLGSTGHRRPASIYDSEADLDFFDLKGDVETVLGAFNLTSLAFEPSCTSYYEQGLSGRFRADGVTLAVVGRLGQDLEREYKLRQTVWLAEFDLESLLGFSFRSRRFQPFSKFPFVERDLSLIVPDAVAYAGIAAALGGLELEEVRSFRPVDRFRGGAIATEHYSLLLRVTFQSQTHTLTSEEVAALEQRLLAALEPLGIRLRG